MMGVMDGGVTMILIGMSDAMMQLLLQLLFVEFCSFVVLVLHVRRKKLTGKLMTYVVLLLLLLSLSLLLLSLFLFLLVVIYERVYAFCLQFLNCWLAR